MPNTTKFLDYDGLSQFLTNLKNAYSGNNASGSTFTVALASAASQLATARTITLTGAVSGSVSFDGSSDVTITTTGAGEANVIEGVSIDGVEQTITNKIATLDLSAYAKKTDYTAVMDFKGTKATVDALPATGNETGDVWLVTANNTEYVYTGSGWEAFGPAIDLSGYVEKTQKVNNKALSGDITLDGSDIALSSNYAVASTAAAPAAGDTIEVAVGKLQKEVVDANAAATTYAFAEGSTNGAFQVTPTVGGVAGQAQSVAVHGLGSAAYADTTAFVPSTLTPAEAGAQVNDIEVINFKGNGDSSAAPLTITNKAVTIDVSGYALSSQIPQAAASIADGATGYATGDQVYDYIEAHKSEWGDANVIESISVNGTAQTITNKNVNITVPTQAAAIADSDTGYATGDQVYDYIEALPIASSEINSLFGTNG